MRVETPSSTALGSVRERVTRFIAFQSAGVSALALVGGLVGVLTGAVAFGSDEYAAECGPAEGPIVAVVGQVACQRFYSAAVGGITAFSYYIPSACAQSGNCPVVYLTHGTGGDYRTYLSNDTTPAMVSALTPGP